MISLNPYAWLLLLRHRWYDKGLLASYELPFPVICVGNLTVGGTGKTPMVEYLIRLFLQSGYSPAVLSRGYGRKSKGFRYVRIEDTPPLCGDEPLQIKRKFPQIPVAVDVDRIEGLNRMWNQAEGKIQVLILDDAFQYRRLRAGLNILLEDSHRPIAKDRLLPFGRLRDVPAAASRAHIRVITKNPKASYQAPLYYAGLCYDSVPLDEGAPVLLVTGVARPEPLYEYVKARYSVMQYLSFPDHHHFSGKEIARLRALLNDHPQWTLLTTEKDATRLPLPYTAVAIRCTLPTEFDERVLGWVRDLSSKQSK